MKHLFFIGRIRLFERESAYRTLESGVEIFAVRESRSQFEFVSVVGRIGLYGQNSAREFELIVAHLNVTVFGIECRIRGIICKSICTVAENICSLCRIVVDVERKFVVDTVVERTQCNAEIVGSSIVFARGAGCIECYGRDIGSREYFRFGNLLVRNALNGSYNLIRGVRFEIVDNDYRSLVRMSRFTRLEDFVCRRYSFAITNNGVCTFYGIYRVDVNGERSNIRI